MTDGRPNALGWPVVLGLGLAMVAQGCSDRAPGVKVAQGPGAKSGEELEAARFLDRFLADLPGLITAAATREAASVQVLESMAERSGDPVLAEVYAKDRRFRFVTARGLADTGELLVETLGHADAHGLDPAKYLPGDLDELTEGVRAAMPGETPPRLLDGEEAALRTLAESMAPLAYPDSREGFLGRLLGDGSPTPGLAGWYRSRVAALEAQAEAMARLELALAGSLERYALDMGRGNVLPDRHHALTPLPGKIRYAFLEYFAGKEPRSGKSPFELAKEKGVELPLVLTDPDRFVRERLVADLTSVKDLGSLRAMLDDLPWPHPQYRKLMAALARYRGYVAAGGWKPVPVDKRLRRGKRRKTVRALKERLAAEEFYSGPVDDLYDSGLQAAIRAYQETHQMKVTGRPHDQFWKSLNITAERRVEGIELTLQRWRESPIRGEDYYVMVNVPDFHLEVWQKGHRILRKPIIAGQNRDTKCDEDTERKVLAHATPMLSAWIDTLIFAPYWNVTRDIKELELDPERGKDPLFYEKHGYEIMNPGKKNEWVREMPSPKNSLGFVKFIFPNPYAVFVHDTPTKKLFDFPVRPFSHGCMRLKDPLELAKVILQHDGKWSEWRFKRLYKEWESMDFSPLEEHWDPELYELLRKKAAQLETTVYLREPVSIHVVYFTVRVDDQDRVHFLADIYKKDEARLTGKKPKRCKPESKIAKQRFRRIPELVDELERQAVELIPRVLAAREIAAKLDPKGRWKERHLIKVAAKLGDFAEHHRNLAQHVREEHERVAELLAKKRRWKKSVVRQAVKVYRLYKSLRTMTREAEAICRQLERFKARHPERFVEAAQGPAPVVE